LERTLKTREEVEREMQALGWWYQHFEFPNGVRTGTGREPGYDAMARWMLIEPFVPGDLKGKSVLDLGGNAGFFSIQMKLRGAGRCVLVDPFVEFVSQAKFAAEQFGVQIVNCTEDAHIYCLTTEERFDYVLFLGLLYHLKYPGLVLDRLAEMTMERIFIQSNILGEIREASSQKRDYERGKEDHILEDPNFPKCCFIEHMYNGDPTNWWLPNSAAFKAMVRSAGLKIIDCPHPHIIIAEPGVYYGKVVYSKLVFPRYGKEGESIYPGPQNYDPELWDRLIKMSSVPEK
jgi:tRNA (mo5U34)-methyltransferase